MSDVNKQYNEYEQLEDLLRMCPGTDCLDSIIMDELNATLKNNGVKYPPFKPGQDIYYLLRNDPTSEDPEPLWYIEQDVIKQISFNEFGDWIVTTNQFIESCNTWGYDIFGTYAMAKLHCDKRNARLTPEA